MTRPSPKPSERRPLPQARRPDSRFEITFPKRPAAAATIGGVFSVLREAFSRGGSAVGDAYAAGARVALERVEAIEDANAERRQRSRRPSDA